MYKQLYHSGWPGTNMSIATQESALVGCVFVRLRKRVYHLISTVPLCVSSVKVGETASWNFSNFFVTIRAYLLQLLPSYCFSLFLNSRGDMTSYIDWTWDHSASLCPALSWKISRRGSQQDFLTLGVSAGLSAGVSFLYVAGKLC